MDKSDEIVQDFKNLNPLNMLNKVSSIYNTIESIRKLNEFISRDKKDMPDTDTQINFSGQHTDIAYVSMSKDGIPTEQIENIEDNILKRNVRESFNDAVADGYLKIENERYQLTDKGLSHINSPEFISQFETDQKYSLLLGETKAVFELNGTSQDAEVFRYAESINLSDKNLLGDKQSATEIMSYFKKLEKENFVTIGKDNIVKPTAKMQEFLNTHYPKKVGIDMITPQNAEELAKGVFRGAKGGTVGIVITVVKTAVKKLQQEKKNNTPTQQAPIRKH